MVEQPTKLEQGLDELRKLTEQTYLPQLRAATEKLVPFKTLVSKAAPANGEIQELIMECGTGLGFGLYKDGHVAIARYFLSSGALFPQHIHGEREVMGVTQGRLILRSGKEEVTIDQYEIIEIPADKPHAVLATEDTWIWVVTMPAAEEFPDAGDH